MAAKKKRTASRKKTVTRARKSTTKRKSVKRKAVRKSAKRKAVSRKSTRTAKKAFTRKPIRKSAPSRKRTVKRVIRRKTRTQKVAENYGWEIVPFVVAVVVAIVVVAQSIQSAKQLSNDGSTFTVRPTVTHMAGGCEVEDSLLREVRSVERALQRALENLEKSEQVYDSKCSADPQSDCCIKAKQNVRRDDRLVRTKIEEIQVLRMSACL